MYNALVCFDNLNMLPLDSSTIGTIYYYLGIKCKNNFRNRHRRADCSGQLQAVSSPPAFPAAAAGGGQWSREETCGAWGADSRGCGEWGSGRRRRRARSAARAAAGRLGAACVAAHEWGTPIFIKMRTLFCFKAI